MEIQVPTLLVDKKKCLRNIERMAQKAAASKATLRPHFKTHFSAEIASWFQDFGVTKCTVSSVSMANYFAENGWQNITIAFPYNPLESKAISELAKKIKLNILIESSESFRLANDRIESPVGYYIKIDVGTHRTGIDPRNVTLIKSLISASNEKLSYVGFLAHAGHTYGSSDFENIKWIFDKSVKTLNSLQQKFGGIISYGDTPSCSVISDLSAFDELRPGNFVFYDWMQHQIGSCELDDIAVCLAAPIVVIHEDRQEVIVYGGGVHLSKDFVTEKDSMGKDRKCFGKMVRLTGNGWNTDIIGHVDRLSQEHGVIKLSKEEIARVKIGDMIGILPVHSCLSADLQGHYLSTSGELIDKMKKI